MNKKLIDAVARQMGGRANLKASASDISNYGAQGGVTGFIYYTETEAFTKKNHSLIMNLLNSDADDMGVNVLELLSGFNCFDGLSDSEIFDGLMNPKSDHRTTVYNGLAWFALEEVARSFED